MGQALFNILVFLDKKFGGRRRAGQLFAQLLASNPYLNIGRKNIKNNILGVLSVMIVLPLSGCNFEWNKPNLSTPKPSKFDHSSVNRSAKPIAAGSKFMVNFASKELTELSKSVLVDNYQIAAAVAQIKQADAAARLGSSPLYPSLSSQNYAASYHTPAAMINYTGQGDFQSKINNGVPNNSMFTQFPPAFPAAGFYKGYYYGMYQVGVGLASYTIDFWGKNEDASYAARLQANASRFERDLVEISQLSSLMVNYFSLLAYQDILAIYIDNVKIYETIYNAVKLRYETGTASAFDLSQQGATLEQQKAQIPVYQKYIEQTKLAIAVLLGKTPESISIKGGSLAKLKFPKIEPGLPSEVLLRRPDIASAEAQLASQEFSVLNARAQFFPSITINSFYGPNSYLIWNLLNPSALAANVMGEMTQPLFDGWALYGNYQQQTAAYDQLVALYRLTIINALQDVESSLVAIKRVAQSLETQKKAVADSTQAFKLQKLQFEQGTIDIIALSYTQNQLISNQIQEVFFRQQYFTAAAALYQALGGGWTGITRDAEIARANAAYQEDLGPWP